MRKQSHGLASLVEEILGQSPFTGELFVFCNKKKDIIKAVYFDKAGFSLWCKKLDQSKFPWLKQAMQSTSFKISPKDLSLLLDGVDVLKRHKQLDFRELS